MTIPLTDQDRHDIADFVIETVITNIVAMINTRNVVADILEAEGVRDVSASDFDAIVDLVDGATVRVEAHFKEDA